MGGTNYPAVNLEEVGTALANLGNPWVSGTTSMSVLTEDERRVRLGVALPAPPELSEVLRSASAFANTSASAAGSLCWSWSNTVRLPRWVNGRPIVLSSEQGYNGGNYGSLAQWCKRPMTRCRPL